MVPVGGVVIMDDILSHKGAQDAWADFQSDQGFTENVLPVNKQWDHHGGWFIKTKDVKVDFSKRHVLDIDE
jgi:pterin-4a-carbinolamine dehydratase